MSDLNPTNNQPKAEETSALTDDKKTIDATATTAGSEEKPTVAKSDEKLKQLFEQLNLKQVLGDLGSANAKPEEKKDHKFWNTQPVPQKPEDVKKDGPLHPDLPLDKIKKEPYKLPEGMYWCTVDIENEAEMKELYTHLTNNYVEDVDSMFRFDYPSEFLDWALKPPGWKKEWNVGIRNSETNKLVGFISGIPAIIKVRETTKKMVEINFLCVHKSLRANRLSPILIQEVTRRVNLHGIFQAVYTAGVKLPTPVSTCRYYHRSINIKKLIKVGFTSVPMGMSSQQFEIRNRLPTKTTLDLREMKSGDEPQIRKILNRYLKATSDLLPEFQTDEEVAHWLMPKDKVVWTYVVEDPKRPNKILDFVSFYLLPTTVLSSAGNNELLHGSSKKGGKSKGSDLDGQKIEAAYLFYYGTNPEPEVTLSDEDIEKCSGSAKKKKALVKEKQAAIVKERLTTLVRDALVKARDLQLDVFNCLNLSNNNMFIDELKFGKGDGLLNYYLYNWQARNIEPNKIGFIML
ncbi:glycylpeptide N-tetradecanoyltransferase [Mycoemilia scoparia]|uniref:Glycylpeptide N-tetradecanoyltransferase n=1 Tax=Mycoemilia scoparia TaxID=417184 RepID=A0A9W7ZWY4_9FUNG|nr:glycylpeptide N-tetradecanoyltransferase [Mycoemilia scoparia]